MKPAEAVRIDINNTNKRMHVAFLMPINGDLQKRWLSLNARFDPSLIIQNGAKEKASGASLIATKILSCATFWLSRFYAAPLS
jgi:hypothetical protein